MLCSSYSGTTEETLAAYDDAGERGAPRIAVTTGGPLAERARRDGVPVIPVPGGFQPRAAVGYSLVSALEAAALCGAAPSLRDEVEAAASLAEGLATQWGPDGPEDGEAKALARRLHGTVPVIAGAELAASAAYRWKCQINENAGQPAFASALPEMDHNEAVGWPARRRLRPLLGRLPRGPRQPPAQPAAHRADRRAGGGRRRRRRARDRARRDADRAAGLARPARRPRLALPRGPARRGPRVDPADRRSSRPRWPSGDGRLPRRRRAHDGSGAAGRALARRRGRADRRARRGAGRAPRGSTSTAAACCRASPTRTCTSRPGRSPAASCSCTGRARRCSPGWPRRRRACRADAGCAGSAGRASSRRSRRSTRSRGDVPVGAARARLALAVAELRRARARAAATSSGPAGRSTCGPASCARRRRGRSATASRSRRTRSWWRRRAPRCRWPPPAA